MLQRVLRPARAQQLLLVSAVRIADGQPHQEAVELRFRQRVRTHMLHRVLCGDDQKRIGKRKSPLLYRDHPLAHRFQERRLRFWRGTVDLIRQQHVGKNRSGDEFELLVILIEDGHSDDVGRQEIAGELNALKGE